MNTSSALDNTTREWLYLDSTGQKGPVPASILFRMLEKGLGIQSNTMVWKAGMDVWQPIYMVEPFSEMARFLDKQWYYVDNDGGQKGPYNTRYILNKMKDGDIDGLTLVYSNDTDGWKKVSDISSLRHAMMKIAAEEDALNEALHTVDVSNQQILTFEHEVLPSISDTITKEAVKKSFTADDGKRYKWDDDDQDWVEDSGPESEDDDDDNNSDNEDDKNHDKTQKRQKVSDNTTTAASNAALSDMNQSKKKKKKRVKKGPNTWVYISGLPGDIIEDEVKAHFAKVGLIAINPVDQLPRIKLYRDEYGQCKGDGVLCYNASESVKLAVDILSGGYIRPNAMITVTPANFTDTKTDINKAHDKDKDMIHDDTGNDNMIKKRSRPVVTAVQRKIASTAMKQALAWNEDDDVGVNKAKALRIVVLENMFHPDDFMSNPAFSDELEHDIGSECSKCGEMEKVTLFSHHPAGIVLVKYKTSYAAQECIRLMDGRYFAGKRLKCHYWDGVTNYISQTPHVDVDESKEQARLDEFGDWLENGQDDLPAELRLRVEGE